MYTRLLLFAFLLNAVSLTAQQEVDEQKAIEVAAKLFRQTGAQLQASMDYLDETWTDGYIPILLDVILNQNYQRKSTHIIDLLEKHTGQQFGTNVTEWHKWLWNRDQNILSNYGIWMASLYKKLDPRFFKYFYHRTEGAQIRLDEVKWGGVKQDGIPPLRSPKMIDAKAAKYLSSSNIVFGVSINGDHRAYPKRILAWHEMFVDEVGGVPIAGVYCTLCGTVIAYDTRYDGRNHALGTSGFLYRSNKLMYDKQTNSLWSTIEGKPVIGPLVGKGIQLSTHSVVTTTWGAWKKAHPDTKVLSIDTGHDRDYGEGVAYQQYFGTDRLMFPVPKSDKRLYNKAEVMIIRSAGYETDPLAISAKFLKKNKVYHDQIGDISFVVLSDKVGSNRAYQITDQQFDEIDGDEVIDAKGDTWTITEDALIHPGGIRLDRLPSHRIFWFAWFNSYPQTRLVK